MLTKAAVLEISKLWDDGFACVLLEVRRRESEIEALKRKLMFMENERLTLLSKAQDASPSHSSSKAEQQHKLLPPAVDGKVNYS